MGISDRIHIYRSSKVWRSKTCCRLAKSTLSPTSCGPKAIHHTDKNILTIVQQLNQVVGLEILTEDGKKWFTAQPTSPYSFFVFVGISFHAWTNGRLHSPVHRVMLNGDEARYSIGLFSTMKAGIMIKAPEELVDEEHPLLYKPYDHRKFMEFYFSDAAAMTSLNPLKDYCGV